MATVKINGKNFATQDGTGAATVHSDVVFPTGHILQVVSASYATEKTTSSTSFVSIHSDLHLNITLSSTSHKVLIMYSIPAYNSGGNHIAHTIYRDISGGTSDTNLGNSSWGFGSQYDNGDASQASNSGIFLDSPSSTAQLTYKLYHRAHNGTSYSCINSGKAGIVLYEVVA